MASLRATATATIGVVLALLLSVPASAHRRRRKWSGGGVSCFVAGTVCGMAGMQQLRCCPGSKCLMHEKFPDLQMRCWIVVPGPGPFGAEEIVDGTNVTLVEAMDNVNETEANASSDSDDVPLKEHSCLAKDQICGSRGFKFAKQCCSGMECVPPSSYNHLGDMLCKARHPSEPSQKDDKATSVEDSPVSPALLRGSRVAANGVA